MQVKRTSPHRSPSTRRGRAVEGAAAPIGADAGPSSDELLGEPPGAGRPGARRKVRAAAEDVVAPASPRPRRRAAAPSAADALAVARPVTPRTRRARAGTGAPATDAPELEVALSIVEMGEALSAPGDKGRGPRARVGGERARAGRRAAQAFVEDTAVAEPGERR